MLEVVDTGVHLPHTTTGTFGFHRKNFRLLLPVLSIDNEPSGGLLQIIAGLRGVPQSLAHLKEVLGCQHRPVATPRLAIKNRSTTNPPSAN